MDRFVTFALPVGAFLCAWWLTGRVREYALARRLMDIPNARSSHSIATPRGGGVSIVVTTLVALLVGAASGVFGWRQVWGLAGSGALVAAVGFADDHRQIARGWRLLAHLAAAAWVLVCMGGLPPIPMFGVVIDFGWTGHVLAALYIVWIVNLTNFMDGIDGIAAIEAITVCLGGALLYAILPGRGDSAAPLILAAGTLGFVGWNWPPAKIFMGDGGSGFLGLMLASLSLYAVQMSPALLWGWMILLGVFVVDATVTLLRRMIRGERFYDPHRTHAYQHAAQRWGGHRPVTIAVAVINVFWLFPLALLVASGAVEGLVATAVAYAPLVAIAVWLRAGAPAVSPTRLDAPYV
jgi:Fuc2NAc and GlcNAc transferase